jgi:serine/threonine-protein kinase
MPTVGGVEKAQVAVLDFRNGTQKILVRGGSDAEYVLSGHLVYGLAGTLRAVPFDLDRLEVIGAAVPVVSQAATHGSGANAFGVAREGTLAYLTSSSAAAAARTVVWVDRHGAEEPLTTPVRAWSTARLSPDDSRVALDSQDAEFDIWIWDFARKGLTRLTLDPANDSSPVWAPDGQHVYFGSYRAGASNLFRQETDGTSIAEQLTQSPTMQFPTGISPDGKQLVFFDLTTNDLMVLHLDDRHGVQPLVKTSFAERNGDLSPDGRWLVYESNDSGQSEIYVRPFPDVHNGRWQVSTGGGSRARWARRGQELFYVAPPGTLMSVRVSPGAKWTAGQPVKLFEGRYYYGTPPNLRAAYDVSLDGRFLMLKPAVSEAQPSPSLVVVQSWFEELKRLVPMK